jgi:hypothetical protein
VTFVEETGKFGSAFGAPLLLGGAWQLGGQLIVGFAGSFTGRNQHGIGRIAQFEVKLELTLEEVAVAVRTLLILKRKTANIPLKGRILVGLKLK